LVLTGGTITGYINDLTTPAFDFTNVPILTAGWVGLINGTPVNSDSYGVHTVLAWNSSFDSGFNLQLTDAVPSGVAFSSASNANTSKCPSCTGAPITGSLTSGIVTYKIIPGPVTYGDSIIYTWTGTVTSCPTNGQIVNTAYMNLYGINPSPGAQVISTCSSAPLALTESSITAVKQQEGVLVNWTNWNESDVSGYILEKAKGGGAFIPLYGTMVNLSLKGKYSYLDIDKNDQGVVWYYRVKIYNIDGSVSYTQIVSVTPNGQISVSAYPNPFQGTFNLTINAGSSAGLFNLNMRDLTGRSVSFLENLTPNNTVVLGTGLSAGVYLVNVTGEGFNKTLKMEKLE
jgi:hypothetical protein